MLKLKAAICDDDTKHTQDIASKLEQYDVVHDANMPISLIRLLINQQNYCIYIKPENVLIYYFWI